MFMGLRSYDVLWICRISYSSRTTRLDDVIQKALQKYKSEGLDLVLFLLPNNQLGRYSQVKKLITLDFKCKFIITLPLAD